MLALFLTRTATITRRLKTSDSGGDYNEPTYNNQTETAMCYLEQSTASESGAVALEQLKVFFDPGVALTHGDLVAIDGIIYEVAGEPAHYTHPVVPSLSHIAATLERTR